ncbi:MAG: NUDIX hydrolase [Alphaproteobacteria bacterium]|jgi:8-oxo-dGTP pyrophosphatase MutT (NUDIX family)|nr:NUDIX hydrolase [Rhodospirillaceae bacterium]MBT6510700.1 NUDIX hydrolase [Rhodospirillaceae bacterium]MBT7613158.1 NUDIX hydrolase [Rhodospirillaceae bacterium]MBT7647449.1 NUDIX hydrolase [Rhodospirillaceae bacterium]MDG2482310.1 NUDIX hydrolase [Alphaproteobacteria bacterium]
MKVDPIMRNPQNYRAYGILLRDGQVMIAAEWIGPVFAWKYPGGGIEAGETAEQAVRREFIEETGIAVRVVTELHDPGTKISPWTQKPYTPIYFLVEGDGEPVVPEHEPVEISFKNPEDFLASDLVAGPEKLALRKALEKHT